MNTWVISDLHFGHRGITKYRPFESEQAHREHIVAAWNDTIKKDGDRIFVLGDAAFTWDGLESMRVLRGRKFLVRGNHDTLPTNAYLAVFEEVYGIIAYKNTWLSHAPIHPHELRGRVNVHGHVHNETVTRPGIVPPEGDEALSKVGWVQDPRYFNACPEAIGYAPVLFRDLVPPGASS